MGYDLFSTETNHDYHFNNRGWVWILEIAQNHGWIPKGTIYDVDYLVNEEDRFRREEEDLPPMNDIERSNYRKELEETVETWDGVYVYNEGQVVTEEDANNLRGALFRACNNQKIIKELDPEEIEIIKGFIGFLKYGSFGIW